MEFNDMHASDGIISHMETYFEECLSKLCLRSPVFFTGLTIDDNNLKYGCFLQFDIEHNIYIDGQLELFHPVGNIKVDTYSLGHKLGEGRNC